MAITEIARIQVRRGQENQTGVPQLEPGEFGWAEDTQNLYIGKRVSEGANNDNNARILTDKDLANVFRLAQAGTISVNPSTGYRYRNDISNTILHSSTGTYAKKLDTWANMIDFTTTWFYSSGTDITKILQESIGTVTNPFGVVVNSNPSQVAISAIKIPAGNFSVSGTISLPPNTKLVGEGAGLTVLTAAGGAPIFQTVDANGQSFFSMNGDTFATQPKNIHIEGMTLISTSTYSSTLILLDNVANDDILNVNFGDPAASTLTSVDGITIRGFSVSSDATLALSSNIRIDDCNFNGLNRGVYQNTGTTNRYYIQNSEFSNMSRGVRMWSSANGIVPVNGLIDNNIFQNIAREAIYIGTITNTTTNSYVISSNNTFRNVGNNFSGDAGTQITPVITFNDGGNSSSNDYFGRFINPINTVTNYPIISGPAVIESPITYVSSIGTDTTVGYTITNFVLTGREQKVSIDYTLIDENNTVFSRTGQLTMNITPANVEANEAVFASVSDYFNYAEVLSGSTNFVIFSTDYTSNITNNYVSLTCWNQLGTTATGLASTVTNFNIEYKLNILQ